MRMYLTLFLSVLGFCLSIAHAGSPETSGIASWGHPVPSAQLETQRGGTDAETPTINTNQLNAKLFNNSATNNVTGNNSIADAAFSGASGLATVIQNSGNNVIIQNGTVLNLTLK
jgi:hypothetical protein